MKGWVSIPVKYSDRWFDYTKIALQFVDKLNGK